MRALILLVVALFACQSNTEAKPPAEAPADAKADAKAEAPAKAEAKAEPAGAYREAGVNDLEDVLGTVPLIDVRSQAEFDRGHVAGAKLMPVGDLPKRLEELAPLKDKEIWLICQSGGRSGRAGQLLKKHGFTVVNVRGGTGAWILAGKPVEK